MPQDGRPFSERTGARPAKPITIWDDAPAGFRHSVLLIARDDCEVSDSSLRDIVCKVLRIESDRSNYSPAFIRQEVEGLVRNCDWFKVYDIIEAIWASFKPNAGVPYQGGYKTSRDVFELKMNELLADCGIGWQMKGGKIEARSEEAQEVMMTAAQTSLEKAGKTRATSELKEAWAAISRRPAPDLSGAIHHAMASLECTVREVVGDDKPTLGELMKSVPDLLPKPLNTAVEKIWGYASNYARHASEGNQATRHEAILVVGLVTALTTYLLDRPARAVTGAGGTQQSN